MTTLLYRSYTTQRSHLCSCYCGENIFAYTTWCDTKNNFKEFDKTKAILSAPPKTQTNQCAACHFIPGTGFIIFGTVWDFCQTCWMLKGKRLLANMERQLQKMHCWSKGNIRRGWEKSAPPTYPKHRRSPPTYPKHRRWNHVVENSPPQLPTIFIFQFIRGKEREWNDRVKWHVPVNLSTCHTTKERGACY